MALETATATATATAIHPTRPGHRVSAVETVEAPARMPAHNGVATPSHGGREGIDGSGVSHHPEANHRNASFVYYFCKKGNNTPKPSTTQAELFLLIFQAGKRRDGNAAFPLLRI
jgi:hypothetical protein